MNLRNAIPMLLAGLLVPAVWGVSQNPPAQPQTQAAPAATGNTARPHHHPGGYSGERWSRGYARGATGGSGSNMSMGRGPGGPSGGRRGGFPPMFDALAKMSPEERNKALESDPHFARLSPERQAQLREHLERYSAMTPEQRQAMRDRFDIVNSMPPQNRDRIREVFPQWRQLPPDRQQAMRREFHSLAKMSAAEREKRFADPEFQKSFPPKEQQLLKDLAASLR